MNEENSTQTTETEAPKHVTLTTLVKSRFSLPVWVKAPRLNEGAELYLKAITRRVMQEWGAKLGICPECGGRNVVLTPVGDLVTCPRCGGKKPKSWNDPEVRLTILRHALHGMRGVKARDIETGAIVDLEFGDDVRDGLADTPAFEVVFELATNLSGELEKEEAKN